MVTYSPIFGWFNLISDCQRKGGVERRRRRWGFFGGCSSLYIQPLPRKLDFHAAVKRPAGVEIGYTEPPEAVERCCHSPRRITDIEVGKELLKNRPHRVLTSHHHSRRRTSFRFLQIEFTIRSPGKLRIFRVITQPIE